ncbi:MAG: sigma 54-interacting transcriptional regulator [Planctomycetota bacterium]
MADANLPATVDTQDLDEHRLLLAISRAQQEFIAEQDTRELFSRLLESMLDLTASEYGFIGEILHTPEGQPYLKTHAITNISWNAETQRFYEENAAQGLEFYNLRTLFGAVITSGEAVISNDPARDPRRGGLPPDHPALNAFLGVPFRKGADLIGMVGLANRRGGYCEGVVTYMEPLLSTCANIIQARRNALARHETKQALRASEARIQAIVNSAIDPIITIDERGAIQSANPATEQVFGYGVGELLGQNVSMLMSSPHRESHDGYIGEYLRTGEHKVIGIGRDIVGRRRDGSEVFAHLTISEVALGDHRLFTGILRDVSALKSAQERLQASLSLVEKSHEDTLAILDQLRLGVMMIDGAGMVRFMGAACRRLFGVAPADAVAGHWKDLCPFGKSYKQTLQRMMGLPEDQREKISAQFEAPDGQHYWMDVEIHDDPRGVDGRILFMYDTSAVHDLRRQLEEHASFFDLIGKSEPMQAVFHSIVDYAKVDVTVLVEGETGTGKELVAQAMHSAGNRKNKPFVAVNCAGLTDSLLGSQLFGHKKGAFTGAISDQAGVFETADGGTVFLDEIGDITPDVQRALLRVLQEREITRLGESRPRKVDVRVIAATHRDLKQEAAEGRFRTDLLYRIRIAVLPLPALRDRRTDIPVLAAAFLRAANSEMGKSVEGLSADAIDVLMNHAWPGNVRELRNAIEIATVRCKTSTLERRDLPPELISGAQATVLSGDPEEAERARICAALRATRGNRAAAARNLGMSRATFYRRLTQLNIDFGDYR